ncbi:hypothetical protein FZC33_18905 [Labrys sp. KNU-23]|uniref:hypothetical protein n=1 Tax=Labrys sp. KNU-23 TaxID=2789216 RepID=UPI0011EE6EAA|nr:hypothetical protein [Labrys sp. KNU-23]QEN88247.1 hypothetical protein FZC33_18905 [Labrys sp. KNU-23]
MRILITSVLAACGLAAAASCAQADGITDFYSIQRGFGYDEAKTPAAPAAMPLWNANAGQGIDPAVETAPGAEAPAAPATTRRVHHAAVRHPLHHRSEAPAS